MSESSRATGLGDLWMAAEASSRLTFSVVLRVHLRPPMGSPAVSSSRSFSMARITSGVFFRAVGDRRPAGELDDLEDDMSEKITNDNPNISDDLRNTMNAVDRRPDP